MKFERIRNTRLAGFVALGATAVTLAGCGSNDARILPIEVPHNAIDLGRSSIDGAAAFGGSLPGRGFVVANEDVSRVYCGGLVYSVDPLIGETNHDEDKQQEFTKQVRPAGPGKTQVDCIYDDWYAGFAEIEDEMIIEHFKSRQPATPIAQTEALAPAQ